MKITQTMARVGLLCIIFVIVIISLVNAIGNKSPNKPVINNDKIIDSADDDTNDDTVSSNLPEITWKTFDESRELTAEQYFVYSCEEGKFLNQMGAENEKVYPASITKLFTAYTALQYLEPDDVITVGDALEMVMPGSSTAGLESGDTLTVEKLIEAMMLPSGNDAAYVLACEVGWQLAGEVHYSIAAERFVQAMNELAKEKGIQNTNFVNPDGIHDDEHYSTYEDLVRIAELAMSEPVIMKYTKCAIDNEEQWSNTNALVNAESEYYCPLAIGLKTGQTPDAGSCLLSAFSYNEETIIVGVFGCPETDDRFDDTLQLFNKILKN